MTPPVTSLGFGTPICIRCFSRARVKVAGTRYQRTMDMRTDRCHARCSTSASLLDTGTPLAHYTITTDRLQRCAHNACFCLNNYGPSHKVITVTFRSNTDAHTADATAPCPQPKADSSPGIVQHMKPWGKPPAVPAPPTTLPSPSCCGRADCACQHSYSRLAPCLSRA